MSAGLFFDILRRDLRVSWAAKITNEWTLNKGGEIEGTVRQCQSKYTTTTTTTNSSSSNRIPMSEGSGAGQGECFR